MSNQWALYSASGLIPVFRTGWRGAVDTLVSRVTGRPQKTIFRNVTVSCYATQPVEFHLYLHGFQVVGNTTREDV